MQGCVINGVQYPSISNAYKCLNPDVSLYTVYSRIRSKGMSVEDAFFTAVTKEGSVKKRVEIDGQFFESIKEAVKKLNPGISYYTVIDRIHRGVPLKQAILEGVSSKSVNIDGQTFLSIKDAVSKLNPDISYATVISRISNGIPLKQAIFTPVFKRLKEN